MVHLEQRALHTESYRPHKLPQALKLIHGKRFDKESGEQSVPTEGTVATLAGFKAAGIRCVGLHQFGERIPEALEQLLGKLGQIPNRIYPEIHYGLAPCTYAQENPDTHTYFIAVEVSSFDDLPEGVEPITVSDQACAIVRKKERDQVGDIYGIVFGYMEENDLRRVMDEDEVRYQVEVFYESLETYGLRMTGQAEDSFVMDLCIPVASKI